MKTYKPFSLLIFALLFISTTFAQQAPTAKSLINEGIELHDAGKYTEAIDKYKQALKLEPENTTAAYELANTLATTKNSKEAAVYAEKIIKINHMPEAYNLLGNIYDDENQFDKAIGYYQEGIKYNPGYQRLHFNMAISYYRQNKFPEASTTIIAALMYDPKHASSHRLMAMCSLKLKNNPQALMAYANFLMLEPQSQRSAEAFQNLQQIISSKVAITGDKSMTITVTDNKDPDLFALETALSVSAASASLETNPNKTPVDKLEQQLKTFFLIAGELSAKKSNKTFFWKYYADYFYKLAKSDNMPAFTRYISLTGYAEQNKEWFKGHSNAITGLSDWVTKNERTID